MALTSPALAAYDIYLQMEGIRGESQDDQHRDWIEVLSFERKAGGMGSMMSGAGAGVGHMGAHEIVITKRIDASSPMLHQAVSVGRHFSRAVLDVRRPEAQVGRQKTYMEITLTDVFVSSVRNSAGGSGPNEAVTLSYAREETSYPQATSYPQTMRRPMNAMPMMQPGSTMPH